MVLKIIHTVALAVGYLFVGAFAIGVIMLLAKPVWSWLLWRNRSDEAKQAGVAMQNEMGVPSSIAALVADEMYEAMDEAAVDARLEYEPNPVATLDWSVDTPPTTDLNVVTAALEDAGYTVHPFPREREGEWSRQYVGIWKREPEWFVDVDGEHRRVTPSIDGWGNTDA